MVGVRLRQARWMAGLTQKQLAARLQEGGCQVSVATISKYERGHSFPDARFLLRAASALHVAGTYFIHKPEMQVDWKSFRRRKKMNAKQQASVKGYASDLTGLQLELLQMIHRPSAPDLPNAISIRDFGEAEEMADALREVWALDNRPLDNLVQTVEDRGIIVIDWEDATGDFDGLSGWCKQTPVTVISTNRSTDRIRFSLAHEIGHLVMDMERQDEEALSNRFAAALLVPAEHARNELGERRAQLDWSELALLKRKYGLSMAAWVRRARDLEIIDANHFKTMNIHMRSRGWHRQEPVNYQGDESPLLLKQLVERALSEGLINADRLRKVGLDDWVQAKEYNPGHLTVRDLKALPDSERELVIERAFKAASAMDVEPLDAYDDADFLEEYDGYEWIDESKAKAR